jgi:hypothetical protein
MSETPKATHEPAPSTDDLARDPRTSEGTKGKPDEREDPSACAMKPPKVKPSALQRGVAVFILLASLGCAAWAILEQRDYPAAAALMAGGLFLAARLGGVLGGG